MRLSAVLLLSSCLLAPQVARAQDTTVLAKADLDSLRAKMQEWMKTRAQARDADDSRKEGARKKEEAAREKFMKDWDTKTAKKNALASAADLRAVFAGCFEYERVTGTGDVRPHKAKNMVPYDALVPKKYKSDVPTPTLVVLRGHDGKVWMPATEWHAATWKAAADAADYLVVMPSLDNSLDFDPAVDLGKPEGEAATGARNLAVVGGIGAANQSFNIDRDRLYLDCAKGTCAFAVRVATYFPNLFAGIVLRHPSDVGDVRLDSLAGLPVLLLRTDETKAAADKLAEALNKLPGGAATVLDAKGTYPYAESAADIAGWIKGKVRNLVRPHVIVANTHDRFRKAYWVQMGLAERLADVSAENLPLLEVKADRATNTITITSKSVSDCRLMLNDALVDLEKDVTLVVNGKARKSARIPRDSIKRLAETVFQVRDNTALFTAEQIVDLKDTEAPAGAKSGAGAK